MLLTMAAVAYRLDPARDPDSAALAWIIIAMDYDQSGIATTYDEARALTPARRRRWQRLLSAHVDRTAISARRWLRMRPHRNARKRCRRAKLLSGGADHARHQLAIRR